MLAGVNLLGRKKDKPPPDDVHVDEAASPLAFWRSLRRSIAPIGPTGPEGAPLWFYEGAHWSTFVLRTPV